MPNRLSNAHADLPGSSSSAQRHNMSCYDILEPMRSKKSKKRMPAPAAEFRHQLRLVLQFSETAAQKRGLRPQQHQLLLQIAGASDKVVATIGYAAERLGFRHNTAVELSNRSEAAGLVVRKQAGSDRRCALP